jgi:hypothetical protein
MPNLPIQHKVPFSLFFLEIGDRFKGFNRKIYLQIFYYKLIIMSTITGKNFITIDQVEVS